MLHYQKGRYRSRYDSSKAIRLSDIIRWKLTSLPTFWESTPPSRPLERIKETKALQERDDFICWLSHASFLIRLDGKRILIDPVFGNIPFYKRYSEAPYSSDEIGPVDYLLISHVHYDHLDMPTLKAIAPKKPHAIIPKGMHRIVSKAGICNATECIWYESFCDESIRITLVPAKHWGSRTLFDKNRALWGAYIIQSRRCTIFFCGDSAMAEHFEQIGKRFLIDYALMPIGAYKPEHIMRHNHLNPKEAHEAARMLGAKYIIPMHYGTFKLSDEPLHEPLERFMQYDKFYRSKALVLKPGEVFRLI